MADLRNVAVGTLAWHQVYKVESNAWDLGRETVLQLVLVRKVCAPEFHLVRFEEKIQTFGRDCEVPPGRLLAGLS